VTHLLAARSSARASAGVRLLGWYGTGGTQDSRGIDHHPQDPPDTRAASGALV
jgi:hypothetical protein